MFALNLAEDRRVLSVTFEEYAAEGQPLVAALPEGDVSDYIYSDGEFIYNPLPQAVVCDKASADEVLNSLLGVTV